jgi:DNA-binding NarL/FixJ family response regulator
MPVISIIAVDDHQLYLEGIRTALSQEADIRVTAVSRDSRKLPGLLRVHNPDIALLDLHMPGFNGPETIRRFSAQFPQTRFVALTGSREEALVRQIALSGARGYLLNESILKDRFPDQLRRIYAGSVLFDEEIVHALLEMQSIVLSPQELEILSLMSQGLTNAGIAEALGLSRKRVANVLSHLYGKLQIDGLNEHRWVTRVVAVREAVSRGLIGIAEPREDYR